MKKIIASAAIAAGILPITAIAQEQDSLDGFVVEESIYHLEGSGFAGSRPYIEITVTNNTPHAVARVYFDTTLKSPERAVPWGTAEFNYSIPGGAEPGETHTWELDAPYSLRNIDVPADAEYHAEVVRIDGPDGNSLY